ncbi:MAG: condensation domain-containing protein, partial [Pseudomonadota bacterium]
ELTAERFVVDPFNEAQSARMYRTGDRVRWTQDGELVFLGRVDAQVKVRGYRVELGDIEACIESQPGVIGAAVLLINNDDNNEVVNERLVAWVVGLTQDECQRLMAQLEDALPNYMLPQTLLAISELPLTANGKLDRKCLMETFFATSHGEDAIVTEPTNEVEAALAEIWCQVLRRDKVGIHDDFFALGGDSILSLQVIARAKKKGYKLTPRLLFEEPTVAKLAEKAERIQTKPKKGVKPLTGAVDLLPIQHWFFESNHPEPHHWNQSMIFQVGVELDYSALEASCEALLQHHDALRMNYVMIDGRWMQRYVDMAELPSGICQRFNRDDLVLSTSSTEKEVSRAIEAKANQLQSSLNLERGPLVRIAYFSCNGIEGEKDRLLLIIHHLVVDGVSWRVLLNDLYQLYQQSLLKQPLDLGEKSSSLREWSQQLKTFAQSEALDKELGYWREAAKVDKDALVENLILSGEDNSLDNLAVLSLSLSAEQTRILLQDAPLVYGTQINDLLLAALVSALCEVSESMLIEMEGHGREALNVDAVNDDLDLSQTIGWFTSRFPIKLTRDSNDFSALIASVKRQLHQVPGKGIGYSVIRYLHPELAIREEFARHTKPLLSFNYLGQFDSSAERSMQGLLSGAKERPGLNRALSSHRNHLIDIVGQVANQQLTMRWQFGKAILEESQIRELAEEYQRVLAEVVNDCIRQKTDLKHEQPMSHEATDMMRNVQAEQLHVLKPAMENAASLPVFFLHHRGGHTREYQLIADALDPSIPVYGIQSQVLSDPTYQEYDIAVVAKDYANLIQTKQPSGPYRLLGWSLGGVLAMAIAEVLEQRGEQIHFIGLIDSMLAQGRSAQHDYQSASVLSNMLEFFGDEARQHYHSIDPAVRQGFEHTLEQLDEDNALTFAYDWTVKLGMVDKNQFDRDYFKLHYRAFLQSRLLIRSYQPRKINAALHLWWASQSLQKGQVVTQWSDYCSRIVDEHIIEGSHFDIIKNPVVIEQIVEKMSIESLVEEN